jgi:Ca2+-binding RTX toxin-like protein
MPTRAPLTSMSVRGALFFLVAVSLCGLAGCGEDDDPAPRSEPPLPPATRPEEITGQLAALALPCTFVSGVMTVKVQSGELALISRGDDDSILVNNEVCVGAETATATNLVRLNVNEGNVTGSQTVYLDFRNGFFGLGKAATTSGTFIALGGSPADALQISTGDGNDVVTAGSTSLNLNGDAYRDTTVTTATGVGRVTVSLGTGTDSFSGIGGGVLGTTPFSFPLVVYGGDGNDVLRGGGRADELYGDGGDDTLTADLLATLGADIYSGGADIDSLSYALRTTAVSVTLDGAANDGAALEGDDVRADIEAVTGGAGADTLTGAAGNNTLTGGAGNDTLAGGDGDDELNGDAGDDTFLEGAASNGADTVNGGAGIDHVDYSGRMAALTVTVGVDSDSDGDGAEGDRVSGDVENVSGGSGNDTITGNELANRLTGGLGNDSLNGEDGPDTFYEGTITSGQDIINGGDGFDVLDYSGRGLAVTVTMSDDTANDGQMGENDNFKPDVEKIRGGAGNDTITGGPGNDHIDGGGGNDTLIGADGDDTIDTEAGDDSVNCGAGNDVAIGGEGTDTFTGDCEIASQ